MIGIGIRIPQTGKAPFSPASLGTPLAWLKGDDATWDGSAELGAGVYSALTNRGSLGGTFASASNAAPIAVAVGARNVPAFRGARRMTSSLAASNWSFLHNGTGAFTITVRFYRYQAASVPQWILATYSGGSSVNGVALYINTSSQLRFEVSNSSTVQAVNVTSATTQLGWNTVTITKSANVFSVVLNSEAAVPLTVTSPSAGAPYATPVLGNWTGTVALNGLIAELVIHGTVLDSSGLSLMRSYMSGQWSATPTFSPISLPTNLIGDWNLSKGVTLNGANISALADQGGLNNDMVQATSGNQPLLVTDWRNGHEAMRGNDLTDNITAALTSGALAQPCTVYCVAQWPATGDAAGYITNASPWEIISREINSGGYKPEGYSGVSSVATNQNTRSTPFVGRWRFATTASEIRVEEHGVAVNSSTGLNFGTSSGGTTFSIGGKSGASNGFLGHIARVIVYDGTPTGAQEDALMAYLRSTYNVVAA